MPPVPKIIPHPLIPLFFKAEIAESDQVKTTIIGVDIRLSS
jgi:hypothetical protein